jgi:hypothetical protein
MPSMTLSVIVEIICLDISAPWTLAERDWISPVIKRVADNEIIRPSTPDSRRAGLIDQSA